VIRRRSGGGETPVVSRRLFGRTGNSSLQLQDSYAIHMTAASSILHRGWLLTADYTTSREITATAPTVTGGTNSSRRCSPSPTRSGGCPGRELSTPTTDPVTTRSYPPAGSVRAIHFIATTFSRRRPGAASRRYSTTSTRLQSAQRLARRLWSLRRRLRHRSPRRHLAYSGARVSPLRS